MSNYYIQWGGLRTYINIETIIWVGGCMLARASRSSIYASVCVCSGNGADQIGFFNANGKIIFRQGWKLNKTQM